MSGEQSSRRRWAGRLLLLLVALPGVGVCVLAAVEQVRVQLWKLDLRDPDPAVRMQALLRIARERDRRAAAEVFAVLAREQDRAALEVAGYAVMRMRDLQGVARLRERAETGPDDAVSARLMIYAARLSRRDCRLTDWLSNTAASAGPWRRVGAALGLLELGQPRGGEMLIELARQAEPAIRALALGEFRRTAEPMAQAVGRRIDWPDAREASADDPRWAGLRAFWQRHATVPLLNDVLTRLHGRDEKWHQLDRLVHSRNKLAPWLAPEAPPAADPPAPPS